MRILHVISGIDPVEGGPAAALMNLSVAQLRAGLKVSVLATYSAGTDTTPAPKLREQGVEAQMIGPCSGATFTCRALAPTLREWLKRHDVLHVHGMWEDMHYQACRAARKLGVPYVVRPCGMLDRWSMSKKWLGKHLYLLVRMRRNLNAASYLHFATEGERQSVARLRLRAPTLVEPLGINLAEFDPLPTAGAFRNSCPQLGGRRYVVYVGRLHVGKGLEMLVPAFAQAALPDTALVIVGPDKGYEQDVRRMVHEHRLDDRVIFTGMLRGRERVAAIADADMLALPSFHENFGIVVVEALACGTPVVVSDQVNLHPEVLANKVGAVVPLNIPALAQSLRTWMSDEPRRREAAERGVALVRQRYDQRVIAQHWVDHYAALVGAPRAATAGASHA